MGTKEWHKARARRIILARECPYCGRALGEPCRNMRTSVWAPEQDLAIPHRDRDR